MNVRPQMIRPFIWLVCDLFKWETAKTTTVCILLFVFVNLGHKLVRHGQ